MKHDDPFLKFIGYSAAVHAALGVVLVFKLVFFSSENLVHQQSVRVDVVALPEKMKAKVPVAETKKEKPKIKEKEKKKEKKKPKAEPKKIKPVQKKKAPKKEQNSAIARLKAMQKIKKQQKETQKVEYKGNELSKGNSLTGLQQLKHDSYLDKVLAHIRTHWNLPEWLADDTLKATVVLYINKDGSIKMKRFLSASGNQLFDDQVMGTLSKAEPLPAPPSDLVNYYTTKGFEVRFPE